MISIFSILSAVVLYSAVAVGFAQDSADYSLWPRRPAELEQARRLVAEQKLSEAVELLRPYVAERGIAGREARQITGAINVRRYLSRSHPGANVHIVKRGENLSRIAASTGCPSELIMLLNGLVEPSELKAGQKVVYVTMKLRMELRPLQREITVWDGSTLVAAYNITAVENIKNGVNEEVVVTIRDGYMNGAPIPRQSTQFLASDREIGLSNGIKISSDARGKDALLGMDAKDLNELSLLMAVGGRVSIIWDEETFKPFSEG
ncbi:MAG: LysM peptidoglycan-binding domain-containing protein [Akkermansia sp.]|nr:LysM peptidoglycan-binding domain-containing protein [Akkermansia sp.]